ncbi:MAG: 2-C-methyl-D-erythritol 2,4-cyclodiphosphate synthase [Treponema sp.]|nr:2-C-methyl-D-erythritol 2,4-cyclodiphosphate synthase [Treponema sp.]
MIRVGLGYDKHVLVEGRKLVLGGVELPFEKGESGHSDGDVLLHAITDALLGASGLGDIGSYFPPSDPQWKDADSKSLLKTCWNDVTNAGWKLGNLDCVIALEKPKFLPYREHVRASIAAVLGVLPEQIFVKAKTGEKLGDIGQSRAVEAWCVCLLEKLL